MEKLLNEGKLFIGLTPDQAWHQVRKTMTTVGPSDSLASEVMTHLLTIYKDKFDSLYRPLPYHYLETTAASFEEDLMAFIGQAKDVERSILRRKALEPARRNLARGSLSDWKPMLTFSALS
ncbi:hypothetical protein GGI17_001850 [Coemansia sp. S146]|nr:hypothetical protein GGI17_001850 [Coemansia sp. S146]